MMTTPLSLAKSIQLRDRRSPPLPPTGQAWTCSRELNRLLSAAVVSRRFCQLLLSDPLLALRQGYNGETFRPTAAEVELLVSVRAETLSDFAAQLLAAEDGRVHQAFFAPDEEEVVAPPVQTRRRRERFVQRRQLAEVSR